MNALSLLIPGVSDWLVCLMLYFNVDVVLNATGIPAKHILG